jgi:putative ABC transport system permease protein
MWQTLQEFRYAMRGLRKTPGFTIVALIVLAVSIGANTAVFSVAYNVMLKSLNYRDSNRLTVITDGDTEPVSPADYLDYRAECRGSFERIEAAQAWGGAIDVHGHPEMRPSLQVSAGLFEMLGIAPERGRWFRAGEDRPGAAPVVIISHQLWQHDLDGRTDVIGSVIRISDRAYTVVGVMPASFQFAPFWYTDAQLWSPLDLANRVTDRGGRSLRVFGRLQPGVSRQQAQAQMTAIAKRLEQAYPKSNTNIKATVIGLQEKVSGPVRPTLLLLLATAGFVLLIACADIANLLLTRAIERRREIAVRMAIGASRGHLVRQLASESLLVSGMGCILGVALASWSLALLSRALPVASLPRQGEISLDSTVLLFAVGISLLTGMLCGLAPIAAASRVDFNETLKQGGRGHSGGNQRGTRGLLIATEIAAALVLLVCAGLMIRTLGRLNAVDAGFNPHRLLTLYVFAPPTVETGSERTSFYDRVDRALQAVPGVQRVSGINHLPVGGDVWGFDYVIPGRPAPAPGQTPSAVYRVVRSGYFETMQISMLRGREFSQGDNSQSTPVVIVNEKLARDQWPDQNPIGQTLDLVNLPSDSSGPSDPRKARYTIVGVAADSLQDNWTGKPAEEFYVPFGQHAGGWDISHVAFVLRTGVEPDSILAAAEHAVRSVDPRVTISDAMPMEQIIADKLWRSRLSTMLLTTFATIALVLAAVGIYGVIAYSVRQRRQEVGIRMTLGARRRDVLWLTMRESIFPVMGGVGSGLVLALAAGRWMTSLLYGVPAADPITFGFVTIGLIAVACAATLIPTWSSIGTDLVESLREE